MFIDFTKLERTVADQLYGGNKSVEMKTYQDDKLKIVVGRLEPGASLGEHVHDPGFEVLYIQEGCGKVKVGEDYVPVYSGMCHYCETGSGHSLINDGNEDLIYFAVIGK
ncbi:MAG: cupin domain-containing protein [Tissierellia bacterium]|nr:cupin domain-containing protein [Tissierellia bacterium]